MSGHNLWDSIERLSWLITVANWGIAFTLLVAFACTVVAIKAGSRKDELIGVEDLQKAKRIADTEKLAGEANERAANTEKETAELEAIVAGRQLTQHQVDSIAVSLKRFAGREVFVTSYSGDAEAARLGIQIKSALARSGIHVNDELGRTIASSGGVLFGVNVSGPKTEEDLVQSISGALHKSGSLEAKPFIVVPTARMGNALTGIMVGLKPIPKTE